ncbi:ComF family protein [Spirochaeta dissipatitropha]
MCGHFAELLAYTIPAEAWGWPIVYIPGHPKNIRFRGWDPMQVTASLLADITGGECLHALVRFKKSRIQKNLDVDQRKKNAEYMFGISDVDIPDRLILIDDITTTGASIKHAAQKLSEQGVGKMYCFTIAQD